MPWDAAAAVPLRTGAGAWRGAGAAWWGSTEALVLPPSLRQKTAQRGCSTPEIITVWMCFAGFGEMPWDKFCASHGINEPTWSFGSFTLIFP